MPTGSFDQRRSQNPYLADILGAVENTDFLQAVSLVTTFETRTARAAEGIAGERLPAVSCKRKTSSASIMTPIRVMPMRSLGDSLRQLSSSTSTTCSPPGTCRTASACSNGCGHRPARFPGHHRHGQAKISRWYWCGVFGELYGSDRDSVRKRRAGARRLDQGSPIEPKTISDSNFAASRLLTLRTRNSAAYKGLHALLMNDGCLDFLEGKIIDIQTFTDGAIDIHHIFPQKWCDRYQVAVRLDHQTLSLHRRTGSSVVAHPAPTWAALNAVPQSTSHGWMSWSAPMPSTLYCSE